MIKCGICVEDPLCSSELERLMEKYIGLAQIQREVFRDGEALCKRMLEDKVHFDILLIDIEMTGRRGVRITEMLHWHPVLDSSINILITGHAEPVLEALETHPFHVLQKPVSGSRFGEIFRAALDSLRCMTTTFDFKKHRILYRIPIQDIYYFISAGHYVRITGLVQSVSMKARLDEAEEHLTRINTWDFMRISKSIIINLNHCKAFRPRVVLMENGEYFSISSPYLRAYRERMADCITLESQVKCVR